MALLGQTDLDVFPLCLGTNVFGWTADRDAAFTVLDAYLAGGGNFIDTADVYQAGASERFIGEWVASRNNRDRLVIATKVGLLDGRTGLAPDTIRAACRESLERLGTDRIDLYYAHRDDPDTPLAETLGAFGELIEQGLVRHVAASNYQAPRLAEALRIGGQETGAARYVALQPLYNLVERGTFEGELQELCEREGLACAPFKGLAMGFLTGKYRPGGDAVDSPRAERAAAYLDAGGDAVLTALDEVAGARNASVATVALAWLRAQPTVIAPIASARDPEQLADAMAWPRSS